ncbi:OB-fold domain-containing protein [Streptomyces sp. NRRL F-5053]|uniref:OB-fold domain-containing protein n=1 Tax=Streptomyces sp. NRRL F-5053 TaxID=1463854 RepID=UPI000ACB7792
MGEPAAGRDADVDDPLYERLASYEGQPAATAVRGRDPVNAPMIRHWCEALGHPLPADGSAPPTMLQVWTMAGLTEPSRQTDDDAPGGRSAAYEGLLGALDEAGCTSVVATNCEQEYVRTLTPGEEIVFDSVIESVSPRKRTGLGTGYFVTTRMDVRAGGTLVGTHRFRILKYRPAEPRSTGEPPAGRARKGNRRPRPVINRDNAGFWAGVEREQLLFQRCTACGTARFPWLPGCNGCGAREWTAEEASGRGTVHSFVVMHHPPFPAFDPPYAVALVELEGGVRIVAQLAGISYRRVRIGMPVRVDFARLEGEDEGLVLPVFRPAGPVGDEEPVCVGDALPPLDVPVNRTLIVAGALASRDFQDVHHDAEAARERGSPDIFMNILTTNGLVGRYVSEWAGPAARLRRVAIRLGVPNRPGDTMTLTGRVTAVRPAPAAEEHGPGRTVELSIRGANAAGDHVTGTVLVELPGRDGKGARG